MRQLAPDLPGCSSRVPKLLQMQLVAKRVHRLPKLVVPESRQLLVRCQPFKRSKFPRHCIISNAVQYSRLQDKEPTVDVSTVTCRLFHELDHPIAFNDYGTETSRRSD